MQSLRNIKIDKFPNLIRTNFVPSSSQKMFIQNTDKMNYGHYVRFEALWNAFLKWLENNQAVFELLCKSDLPQEIIEVIMIKANMWFSDDIFETLQKEQCKIIGKFDTYIGDIRVNTICIKELLKHIEIQHGQTKYIDGKLRNITNFLLKEIRNGLILFVYLKLMNFGQKYFIIEKDLSRN